MTLEQAVELLRQHGATDRTILNAYTTLRPEHTDDIEGLRRFGVSDDKLVRTAIDYEKAFGE